MFQKILLAYDGSEHSQRAAAMAQDLALKYGSAIRIVYAFNPISRIIGNPALEERMQRETTQGNEIVEQAAAPLRAVGLDPHLEVLEGPPADAILRVAQVREVDLIIMGSRGLGSAIALFLGSVSNKVLQEAQCPVLITR
ncbi:MAG: universal stress protein [Chloroflexi bacterium UTCFX4]|jgi:nucleotide-binding universal stress UspA family protein|nr:MAG: universal stress protein [Chloroflexi bacterium UTCFX4]OQY97198.1 MAG: universal stress protein [Chloroflexi bacterium UTCFX4]